jgi:hypothetical protein
MLVDGNKEMQDAIRMCLDADEKLPSACKLKDLFDQYERALAQMMPFVKSIQLIMLC